VVEVDSLATWSHPDSMEPVTKGRNNFTNIGNHEILKKSNFTNAYHISTGFNQSGFELISLQHENSMVGWDVNRVECFMAAL
jgi:hypothetical protein